jgi:hypothetical protein
MREFRDMRSNMLTIACAAAILVLAGCNQSVPAPKSFKDFHSTDGVFACDCPEGWTVEGGGGTRTEYSETKFTSGGAEIRIEADLAGSLFADMGRRDDENNPPVARVHAMKTERIGKDEFTNYKEREAKKFNSKGLGEGRKAIFVADGGMGGKIYGYHATLLTNDKRITIICQCPATNWKTLRPAFDRVIASMGR